MVFGIELVDKVLKIDDPVGAVGVHFCNGLIGTLCVGLFSDGTGTFIDGKSVKGLFTGGGAELLGIEALGVVSVCAWVFITMAVVFLAIKYTIGLRASREEEILGLDVTEHNLESSYADFMPSVPTVLGGSSKSKTAETEAKEKKVPESESVPVQVVSDSRTIASDVKLSRVDIICKQSKFEELKDALNSIGVMGITVTQVLGCGAQKGNAKFYRGVQVDMVLLPKVKVEVVVSKVPVAEVVKTAKKVLYTGQIGDGKIFVYDVENVIKVRTGEEGFDALQGEDLE